MREKSQNHLWSVSSVTSRFMADRLQASKFSWICLVVGMTYALVKNRLKKFAPRCVRFESYTPDIIRQTSRPANSPAHWNTPAPRHACAHCIRVKPAAGCHDSCWLLLWATTCRRRHRATEWVTNWPSPRLYSTWQLSCSSSCSR